MYTCFIGPQPSTHKDGACTLCQITSKFQYKTVKISQGKAVGWVPSLKRGSYKVQRNLIPVVAVDTYIRAVYGFLCDGSGDMKKEAEGDQACRKDTQPHR